MKSCATEPGLRLFCFPYAGGNEYVFRGWQKALSCAEVHAVRLPGRGARMHDPHCRELSRLVNELADGMQSLLDLPFAFFGHSMGALISFELARAVRDRYGIRPAKLFVSGRGGPHLPRKRAPVHNRPDEEVLTMLRELNGTPPEVLRNEELMRLTLPLVRADLQLVETYVCQSVPPLDCPIVGFTGIEDEGTTCDDMYAWQVHTTSSFSLYRFPGNHFFIRTAEALVLERLSQELMHIAAMARIVVPDDVGPGEQKNRSGASTESRSKVAVK